MATLKLTPSYLNNYEMAHSILSKNRWFTQESWEDFANKGELDRYVNMLSQTDKIKDIDDFYQKYNFEYSDKDTYNAALFNETSADRTNTDTERTRYVLDEQGKYVRDPNNPDKYLTETYKASDYEYYKSIIKAQNDYNYEKYLVQSEEDRINSWKAARKFVTLADIAFPVTQIGSGILEQLDDLNTFVAASIKGITSTVKLEGFSDAFVKAATSDKYRLFEKAGILTAIDDFERRYSHFKDSNGNYVGLGKYLGGVCKSLGQMTPSMALSVTGVKGIQNLSFYAGITAGNVEETVNTFNEKNISVPSWQILANAAVKSSLQYGVEIGLAKILGGSALDNLVFGRPVSTGIVGTSLTKSATTRLLNDFIEEGLEEVFQDTSDFLVDRAFTAALKENFNVLTNISFESLTDSFIIGGLASFAGNALRILTTKREIVGVEYDKRGDVKAKKLSKLASWEYGLNMQSFLENFETLSNEGDRILKEYVPNSKEAKKYTAAFTEMYAAYRMITSIYNEIGEERFKAANDILTSITNMINAGKFSTAIYNQAANELATRFSNLKAEALNDMLDKLNSTKATKISDIVDREDVDTANVSDETKANLKKLFDGDDSIFRVIVTEDGETCALTNNTIFVPLNYVTNNGDMVYETIAEQTLVESIAKGQYKGTPLDTITKAFRDISGQNTATTQEAIYNLIFNPTFFTAVISNADIDVYKLITSLKEIEASVITNNLRNTTYKNKISTAINSMTASLFDYLCNQTFADYRTEFFTENQQRKIAAARWAKNLYNRVINNNTYTKLTDADWQVLQKRINALPVTQHEKDIISRNLQSQSEATRTSAMNRIADAQASIFYSKYDGKTYMPDTNIPNKAFNMYLQNNNLTLQTLVNENTDLQTKQAIADVYGEFNFDNFVKFRQDQFIKASENKYTFRYTNGKIGIFELATNKQVGFSQYNAQTYSVLSGNNLQNRTIVERTTKHNYLVKDLLNSNIDNATAAYLSIDDIISDPSLLSDDIRNNIITQYGDATIENTFLYLRQYFLDKLHDITVIALQDGTYAFGNIHQMTSVLQSIDFKIDKNTTIKQLIKSKYLYGSLDDVKIKLVDTNIVAEYDSNVNTIFINKNLANKNSNLLTFALLHEFQHAIQTENRMNLGINAKWLQSNIISKTMRQNIIKDIRKHRPELFENVEKGSSQELEIVNNFVYFASGESTAMGIDASTLLDFYPVIVSMQNGTKITMPWGTSYQISNNVPMSILNAYELFDRQLSSDRTAICKQFLLDFANAQDTSDINDKSLQRFRKYFSSLDYNEQENLLVDMIITLDNIPEITKRFEYGEELYYFVYDIQDFVSNLQLEQMYDKYGDIDIENTLQYTQSRMLNNFIYNAAELYLQNNSVRKLLDTANTKTLSVNDLINEYNNNLQFVKNLDPRIKQSNKIIIDTFKNISIFNIPKINVVSWLYYDASETDKRRIRISNAIAYQYGNYLRYNPYYLYSDSNTAIDVIPHEICHFILNPVISNFLNNQSKGLDSKLPRSLDTKLSALVSFFEILNNETVKDLFKREYVLKNIDEFSVGVTNSTFISELDKNINTLANQNLINNVSLRKMLYSALNIDSTEDLSFSDLYIKLIDSIITDINYNMNSQILDIYQSAARAIKSGALYNNIQYEDTHEGVHKYTNAANNTYGIQTKSGKVIFSDSPYFLDVIRDTRNSDRYISSLGDLDNQSLASSNVYAEQKLLQKVKDKAKSLFKENKKISVTELTAALNKAFPFIEQEVIDNIVSNTLGVSRQQLDTLNKEAVNKIDTSEIHQPQNRGYIEPEEGQTIIKNTSGQGKWIEKRARLDANGEFIRNKDGKIIYDYVYSSKRYVSQKQNKGTNLEKFGYVGPYKRTQLSPELQSFIVNANENIDTKLWQDVVDGKITTQKVMDYFRDSSNIDDATFKLINDSYFHNTKINSFEQLQDFIKNKTDKYYAMRAVLKSFGYSDLLLTNTDTKLLDKFLQIIKNDAKLKSMYDEIVTKYYTYRGSDLEISEKNMRRLWMQYFDGSAQSAGYLAAIAKAGAINNWFITGEGSTQVARSLQESVANDMSLEDVYADKTAPDAFETLFYSTSKEEKIESIMKVMLPSYIKKLYEHGFTEEKAMKKAKEKYAQFRELTDEELDKRYAKYVKNMSDDEINRIFTTQLIAESAGLKINKLSDKQLDKLNSVTNIVFDKTNRPSSAIANNIRGLLRTIKSNLSAKDAKLFVKNNSDLVTPDLKIKDDLLHETKDGRSVLVDASRLVVIEDRLRQLSKDVRAQVYKSSKSLDFKTKMNKEIDNLQKKLVKQLSNEKTVAVTYNVADEKLEITGTKEIPQVLKTLLETEFKKARKSETQYLIEGDKAHIVTNMKTFLQENAEFLNSLTQEDAENIADFYSNSEILPSTNKARAYSAIQVYLMSYLLKGNRLGQFALSEESANQIRNRLETIISISAQNLTNWKTAMSMLKPEQVILQSLANKSGIQFSEEDVDRLIASVKSGDINNISNAKSAMYDHALQTYRGTKTSFFDKLLKFERLAMLSSPGTWVRNRVSNIAVSGLNKVSEQIGNAASKMIEKLFPKKKWSRDNQYKLIGTKVSNEIQSFIKTQFIDSGLLNLVKNGFTKYDERKTTDFTSEETLSSIIAKSITSELFQDNYFKNKALNKVQRFVMQQLSDDIAIEKAAIRYFGKMLAEDNLDLSKGITNEVINVFANAYRYAAQEYMHKSNFFNKIESQLHAKFGDGAYFMYKQVFPFAAASWNWFVEGLHYSPVGLIKSIVDFAKLENVIEKLDKEKQAGESVVSSRFAEYTARRNIGKGVIGSIGWAIGAALAGLGFAGIDDEDDQYKLFVNIGNDKVTIDISDLFGTQGIMLGISMISAAKNGDWLSAIGDTLNTMFLDSSFADLFNSFRYSNSFGDWLLDRPYSILNMFIPNFVKMLSSISNKYKVKYSKGLLGKIEKLAVNAIPGIAYAFPKQIDPYTGENQVMYKMWFITNLTNKLSPFKIYPYNVSNIEKEAIYQGVKKSQLRGNYTINGKSATLGSEDLEALNEYYGKLNNKSLANLFANKTAYKVWDDAKKKYVELKYSAMKTAQKKTVIERIMSNNSQIAKVYILTSSNKYKYYASESEYEILKKLGIKNVYKETEKLSGFKTI